MSAMEAKVRAAVEGGQTVECSVIPIYEGATPMLASLGIHAHRILVDGAPGLDLDGTIENVPRPIVLAPSEPVVAQP